MRLAEYGFLIDNLVEHFVFWKQLLVVVFEIDLGKLLKSKLKPFILLSSALSSVDSSKFNF